MFYVQLAPLGVILGPLKPVLALLGPFRATFLIRQEHTEIWFAS